MNYDLLKHTASVSPLPKKLSFFGGTHKQRYTYISNVRMTLFPTHIFSKKIHWVSNEIRIYLKKKNHKRKLL